ncbi:endoribonuclease YbeY isoform X8 [Papio anubis]|uniref:endoribonuclease YbeY isoform X8 n=1 Tax=Papio anubis TaxID=9555 RepID=UPI0004F1EE03|nr:endoribonuclease YbeY isoform X8 [Papio anubis]
MSLVIRNLQRVIPIRRAPLRSKIEIVTATHGLCHLLGFTHSTEAEWQQICWPRGGSDPRVCAALVPGSSSTSLNECHPPYQVYRPVKAKPAQLCPNRTLGTPEPFIPVNPGRPGHPKTTTSCDISSLCCMKSSVEKYLIEGKRNAMLESHSEKRKRSQSFGLSF